MHANYITGERPCPIEPHRPAAAANSSTGGDNTDGEATMDISLLVSLPVNELIKLLINQCAAGVERERGDAEPAQRFRLLLIQQKSIFSNNILITTTLRDWVAGDEGISE